LYNASMELGSQSGQSLQVLQLMAKADFSYEALKRKFEVSSGKKVTPEQDALIKKQAEEIIQKDIEIENLKKTAEYKYIEQLFAGTETRKLRNLAKTKSGLAKLTEMENTSKEAIRLELERQRSQLSAGVPISPVNH
jgi:hypothetical protein